MDSSIAGSAFSACQPVIVPDVGLDPRYYRAVEKATGFKARALLALPLRFQDCQVGVLEVENKRDDSAFGQADVDMLTALAAHAAVAIENARLYAQAQAEIAERTRAEAELRRHRDQLEIVVQARVADIERINAELERRAGDLMTANVQLRAEIAAREQAQARIVQQQRDLAVMQERERTGRELHDNLGQVMSYVSAQSQAAIQRIADGKPAEAEALLERLVSVAAQANLDMREYIAGVRSSALLDQSFHTAMEHYLRRFGQISAIRAELDMDEWPEDALEPTAKLELLRIVQEALTNVRKHAQARLARVSLKLETDPATGVRTLQVTMQDDGVGFARPIDQVLESEGGQWTGLGQRTGVGQQIGLDWQTGLGQQVGLGLMRDRAHEIGGSLRVVSAPGQGARIIVRVPLAHS
ncbi:MAG: GAF domain-containing protein [Thermoflexales bacterium]|nr:GAF domain-containing protein [Thermoflexales bacterium]